MILYLFLVSTAVAVIIDESKIKEFKWRGPPVIDETIFTNPNSFDYDFNDDLTKPADVEDIYDQNVDQLPSFNVFKIGKNLGVTKLPLITRGWQTWSTMANTRGPQDFFATPSTPVSPVFVSTEEPMVEKTTPMSTTIRRRISTTVNTSFATLISTTMAPTTVPTTTQAPVTTTEKAIFTTRGRFFQKIAQQPPPAFKTGRGPIWRKGGRIEFEDSTTTAATVTTTTAQNRNTFFSFTRRPLAVVPGFVRNFGNHRSSFRSRGRMETATVKSTTISPPISRFTTTVSSVPLRAVQITQNFDLHPAAKPVVIHHGPHKYRGPTYNCRVLNPFEDGVASGEHNGSCKMVYPGMSADGQCRCYYTVSGRDEQGCATGFLYACKPLYLHSVVV